MSRCGPPQASWDGRHGARIPERTDGTRTGTRDVPVWVRDDLGSPTGAGIHVGVIDSGWDRRIHDPRVARGIGLAVPGNDFTLERSDDDHDRIGHGTACADLILRTAPGVRIIPIRVFGRRLETSIPIMCAALNWAVRRNLPLVNLSLGTVRQDAVEPLYRACEEARSNGTIIVAANRNSQGRSYPAAFENVIGVAAGRFASAFEFKYREGAATECIAKGVHEDLLWTRMPRRAPTGNSFAAPVISALVALILEHDPRMSLTGIRALLAKYAVQPS